MDQFFASASSRHFSTFFRTPEAWNATPREPSVSSTTGSISGNGPSGS